MLPKLACPPFRQATHVGLRAELEAAGRTRLDARRRWHGLIRVVERGLLERHVVPLDARNLARLAADARGDVNVFADLFRALDAGAGNGARMAGNRLDLECARGHGYAFSIFTRNPLNSGVYALGSIAVGDRRFAEVSSVLPASSAIPR